MTLGSYPALPIPWQIARSRRSYSGAKFTATKAVAAVSFGLAPNHSQPLMVTEHTLPEDPARRWSRSRTSIPTNFDHSCCDRHHPLG